MSSFGLYKRLHSYTPTYIIRKKNLIYIYIGLFIDTGRKRSPWGSRRRGLTGPEEEWWRGLGDEYEQKLMISMFENTIMKPIIMYAN